MTMTKKGFVIGAGILSALLLVWVVRGCRARGVSEDVEEIRPEIGDIREVISTTGTVEPQNRLEIKPPIGGRIEEILVREGDTVKAGQTLAWMSSTERAALLDAARTRGPEQVAYWKDVYKATPLIAPIDAEVIVRAFEPGQTVTATDAVLVISDCLIVDAQVDETDIGSVRVGQEAVVSLDAYPDVKVPSRVSHISYESTVVSNVTIYKVDVLPDKVPGVFRSGMSTVVEIIVQQKRNVLRIPISFASRGRGRETVTVLEKGRRVSRKVRLGVADEKYVEVLSGLTPDDTIVLVVRKKKKSAASKADKGGSNPFMPKPSSRRR